MIQKCSEEVIKNVEKVGCWTWKEGFIHSFILHSSEGCVKGGYYPPWVVCGIEYVCVILTVTGQTIFPTAVVFSHILTASNTSLCL